MHCTSKGIIYDDADKFSYWQFEFYPESVNPLWKQIMNDSGMEFVVSPLHSEDIKADGSKKKPHYHCIYHQAGGPVKYSTAFKRLSVLGIAANDYIEPCFHPKNAQRYLIHLDDPDKSQFQGGRNAIEVINGFPLDLTHELTQEQKREIKKKCFEYIRDYSMTEYHELLDTLLWVIGDDDCFEYASNHTILFKGYLDSKRNSGITEG